MDIPAPILIGYVPKKTMRQNAWFGQSAVEEVCSVSDCMSVRPQDWIDGWKHNSWSLYDSEQLAWDTCRDNPTAYDMYAYKLFPLLFEGTARSPIDVSATSLGDLADYVLLGYDPVSREHGMMEFCHSPLSCNAGFEQYDVNRYCLIDDLVTAWRITEEIAIAAKDRGSWEPGPYCLCEVYRRKGA
jgi:hypothetical protein